MDNEPHRFARLAVATARRAAPPRLGRHAGPLHHPASLLAVLLLKEHLRLTSIAPPRTCCAARTGCDGCSG